MQKRILKLLKLCSIIIYKYIGQNMISAFKENTNIQIKIDDKSPVYQEPQSTAAELITCKPHGLQ